MRLFLKTTCISLTFAITLTACSESNTENSANKVEKVKMVNMTTVAKTDNEKILERQENKDWEGLEKGDLVYGQSIKGGYSTKSVQRATYKESDKNFGIITAQIQVKNIRKDKKPYDLSEFKYFVRDSKTGDTFKGEAIPSSREEFENLPSNTSIDYDVVFKVKQRKDLNDNYLYIDSDIEPSSMVRWQLYNLTDEN